MTRSVGRAHEQELENVLNQLPLSTAGGVPAAAAGPALGTFRQIFEENLGYAWRALRHMGVPEGDLDDVCQEVFLIVDRKLEDCRERAALRAWIYGICWHLAKNHARRAHLRHETLCADVPEVSCEAPQESGLARAESYDRLRAMLDGLDEDKRVVFVLRELEELSMRQVAQAVGCPLFTAYSRLRAARAALRAACREFAGGGSST